MNLLRRLLRRVPAVRKVAPRMNAASRRAEIPAVATSEPMGFAHFTLVRQDERGFWLQTEDHTPVCLPYTMFLAVCEGLASDDNFPDHLPEEEAFRLRTDLKQVAEAVEHQALLWI